MNRCWKLGPIFVLALAGCTTALPPVSPEEIVVRATKQKDQAIVLERRLSVVAENAISGPFSYEITDRTKVLSFEGLERRKVVTPLLEGAKLVSFEGRTMQPDGSEVPADAAAARVEEGKIIFELPQPAVGAVLEYRFKVHSQTPLALFYWQFQREIPVVSAGLTVSWPKKANLGYQIVNHPSGQPTEPDVGTASGPKKKKLTRVSWSFFDLTARSKEKDRFAIVIGPQEFLTEANRSSGVVWEAGFEGLDDYLPRTSINLDTPPSGQPPADSGTGKP